MNQKTKKHSETAERIMLFIGAASLLLAFCICFGCTGNSSAKTLQQLFDEISSTGKMAALTAVPTEDYFPVFGIETDKVEDSVFYIAAIFKAVDETYAKTLERIFKARIQAQAQLAQSYSIEQYDKIKSTQIKRNGCYVYYVVSESGAELTEMLDSGIAGIIAQG
jgi:hypothetical protein